MPELPEVERLRRSLMPHLVGARVGEVVVHRADVCACWEGEGEVAATPGRLLEGATIAGLHRLGKHLAIETCEGRAMEIHLGMSGQVLVREEALGQVCDPGEAKRSHTHVSWVMQREGRARRVMIFRDPRRFGGIWGFASLGELRERRWAGLGPDALEVSGERLFERTRGSARAIKAGLLDQRVLAGVGNIYADESLFLAGIAPRRRAERLSREQCERLAACVRGVLAVAIEAGGSTLRDYVDADGRAGASQFAHRVYGRGGQACVACGRVLRSAVVGQRTTVWCGGCQK